MDSGRSQSHTRDVHAGVVLGVKATGVVQRSTLHQPALSFVVFTEDYNKISHDFWVLLAKTSGNKPVKKFTNPCRACAYMYAGPLSKNVNQETSI